jgi:hypothetical protein
LCGRNADLEIGWRARKESHGIRCADAGLSSGMDVGRECMVKLRMNKRLASERQSGRYQKRVGIRTGGNRLEENEDASKRTVIQLVLPGRLLSTLRFAWPGVCCEQNGRCRPDCFCRQAISVRSAPGALSGKVKEARAAGAAMGRASNGHADEVGAGTAGLNGKPNQAGVAAAWCLPLRRPIEI